MAGKEKLTTFQKAVPHTILILIGTLAVLTGVLVQGLDTDGGKMCATIGLLTVFMGGYAYYCW